MRSLIAFILINFLSGSCSIIKDDDIQSQEELNSRLKLSRIYFSSQLNSFDGSNGIGEGRVSALNNGQISRIDWELPDNSPDFIDPNILIRANYFPTPGTSNYVVAFSSTITYGPNGYPSSIKNIVNETNFEFESWEYSYNSSNRIATIVTKRISEDGSFNISVTDELTYTGDKLSKVDRTYVDLVSSTTKNHTITVVRNSASVVTKIVYEELPSRTRQFSQFCPSKNCYYYFSEILQTNEEWGNPQAVYSFSNGLQSLQLIDQRNDNGTSLGADFRNSDRFYFNPLLILPDLFVDAVEIGQVFIDDWWDVDLNATSGYGSSENRTLIVDYKYLVNPL